MLKKNDLKKPIGFFLKHALPRTTTKMTTFPINNESEVGMPP